MPPEEWGGFGPGRVQARLGRDVVHVDVAQPRGDLSDELELVGEPHAHDAGMFTRTVATNLDVSGTRTATAVRSSKVCASYRRK